MAAGGGGGGELKATLRAMARCDRGALSLLNAPVVCLHALLQSSKAEQRAVRAGRPAAPPELLTNVIAARVRATGGPIGRSGPALDGHLAGLRSGTSRPRSQSIGSLAFIAVRCRCLPQGDLPAAGVAHAKP